MRSLPPAAAWPVLNLFARKIKVMGKPYLYA